MHFSSLKIVFKCILALYNLPEKDFYNFKRLKTIQSELDPHRKNKFSFLATISGYIFFSCHHKQETLKISIGKRHLARRPNDAPDVQDHDVWVETSE